MATQLAPAEERSGASLPALTPEGERFQLRQRQAKMFAMSPLVPEHLRKGSPEQAIANCWIALTLAEAMGEVPLIVMQNIHVVNGKAGFASQYMIARANSSGIFKGRIDWRIERDDPQNLSVTAYAYLRETGQEVSVTCDMKMAKAEGWTKNPKYGTMPEVMLRYRSAAFLVRFYAPDVMLGYQTAEEVEDVVLAAAETQPPLNARMLIDQAKPDEPPEEPTSEEATADASKNGPASEQENADPVQGQPTTLGDQLALDEHPAQAKAGAIIAEIEECGAKLDVDALLGKHATDIQAMPAELGVKIEVAADKRKRAIEATRSKGAVEGVE